MIVCIPTTMATRTFAIMLAMCLAPALSTAEVARVTVFKSGEDGYKSYRIPAIVRAANGELLAFAEGRKNGGGDAGDIDIFLKRSKDLGKTWGAMQLVQDEFSDPTADVTIGNPTPVVYLLEPTHPGRIWLPFTRNNRRVFVTHSDDNGLSWSDRRDITETAKNSNWGWYATGPCHGIQLTRGKNAGTLIIPSDHRPAEGDGWGGHILYSSDHGVTWKVGGVDTRTAASPIHPNENVAVELVGGRIYFNARDQK